jgi:uncharacterized protein YdhG (YjbR/CyaY superfamily)
VARSKAVDAWFARYDNPMKPVVMRMREIILAADARMDECIKWQAPTFTFGGNLASFYPKSKQHASLMFHVGAQIPGKHPRLEGTGETSRVMKIASVAEAEAARGDLERIVKAWCAWKATDAEPAAAKRRVVTKPKRTTAKRTAAVKPKRAAAKRTTTKPVKRRRT